MATPRAAADQTFRLTYTPEASAGPITGRAFLFVSRSDRGELASVLSEPIDVYVYLV